MRLSVLCSGMILLSCILMVPVSSELTARFLDVGEGNAVLLQSENKTMLVDCGTEEYGNLTRVYLKSLGIEFLDFVMITSPAQGNTGGLMNIINSTPVGRYYHGGWDSTDPAYRDLLARLHENTTPVTSILPESRISFTESVTIEMLKPGNKTWDHPTDTLIPKIICGNISILLMGDDPIVLGDSAAEILRVGDHGSRKATDAGFISRINPEVAIISTGPNQNENPSIATLNLLENNGVSVLRTDYDGVIIVQTDGNDYTVGKLRMEPEMTISLVSVVETRAPA